MNISVSLEVFSKMTKEDINNLYKELKQHTRKVNDRTKLEANIKHIVKMISLLKWHLGIETIDTEKDMSKIKVNDLREIHQAMRKTMTNGRTINQKKQRIARMIQVVDYFLQY